MTIVESLTRIASWLNEGVCQDFKFKVPPEVDKPMNDKYEYQEVHPHAFPVFMPTKDKLQPGILSNMPSVIVQIVEGQDDIHASTRDIKINLGISCWNPGTHSKDIYYPKAMRPEEPEKYKNTYDGWMDAWNFTDGIIRKLESQHEIGDMRITGNISFGSYKEQESIVDMYPMWLAWIQFTIRTEFLRNCVEYTEFL